MRETWWCQYRDYPDKTLFRMHIPPEKQAVFMDLWHSYPDMSVSELARRSGISRPTVYSLFKKLARRGDVRGSVRKERIVP